VAAWVLGLPEVADVSTRKTIEKCGAGTSRVSCLKILYDSIPLGDNANHTSLPYNFSVERPGYRHADWLRSAGSE
jgi:hypothetical protein